MVGGRRRNVRRRVNHEDDDFMDHMMQQEGEGFDNEEHFDESESFTKVGKKKAEKMAKKEEKKAMREYVSLLKVNY